MIAENRPKKGRCACYLLLQDAESIKHETETTPLMTNEAMLTIQRYSRHGGCRVI